MSGTFSPRIVYDTYSIIQTRIVHVTMRDRIKNRVEYKTYNDAYAEEDEEQDEEEGEEGH